MSGTNDDAPALLSIDGGVATITLHRPERRNAVTGPMASLARHHVVAAGSDPATKAVVLRGAGGAFCSGLDLKEFNAEPPPPWLAEFGNTWRALHIALFECPVPIVVALERFAINGGAALALAADLLVVGEHAFLQVGEIQQGAPAPMNVAWLRARHSEAVTANLVLTGRRIMGPELHALGVAGALAADDEVGPIAGALAESLAATPDGGRRVKAGMRSLSPVADADEWFRRPAEADPFRGTDWSPEAARP